MINEKLLKLLSTGKIRLLLLVLISGTASVMLVYLAISRYLFSDTHGSLIPAVILYMEVIILEFFLYKLLKMVLLNQIKENSYRQLIFSLSKSASTDVLTKLYNRMFIETCLEAQIDNSFLLSQQLSIILVDLDNFKQINDTYGHLEGDKVLAWFSELILKYIRKSDFAARFGGDEFIIVLPTTDIDTAAVIAERIKKSVNESIPNSLGNGFHPEISCSIGISNYPLHCNSKEDLIKTADSAMYKAKKAGRNRVVVYKP